MIKNQDPKLAGLIYQNLYHRVFHLAQKLLTLSSNQGHDLLEPFLAWSSENQLTMDWTMHIHLLTWLHQHDKWSADIKRDRDIVKELLIASVIRWSLSGLDHVKAKGIMVASPYLPGLAVGLWKNQVAGTTHKIVIMRLIDSFALSLKQHLSFNQTCYALAYADNWRDVEWHVIHAVPPSLSSPPPIPTFPRKGGRSLLS